MFTYIIPRGPWLEVLGTMMGPEILLIEASICNSLQDHLFLARASAAL